MMQKPLYVNLDYYLFHPMFFLRAQIYSENTLCSDYIIRTQFRLYNLKCGLFHFGTLVCTVILEI